MKVSVVIPCYNAADTIGTTLESVMAQSFKNFEVLVVNDGSTDHSAQIVQQYRDLHGQICLINTSNQGVSAARNTGVSHAHGDYIAFLDADDLWYSEKLASHVAQLESQSEIGVGFSRVAFLNPAGMPTGTLSANTSSACNAAQLLAENPTTTSSNLFVRRQVFEDIGGFNENMRYAEDQEWLARMLIKSQWQLQGLNQVLMGYRTSHGGLSAQLEKMEAGWEYMVSQINTYAPALVECHAPRARATYLRYLARRAFRLQIPPKHAMNFLRRAIAADWTLFLAEPRRSILTALAVCAWALTAPLFNRNNQEKALC